LKPSKNAIISRDFSGFGADSMTVALCSGLPDKELGTIRDVVVEPLTGKDEQRLSCRDDGWRLPAWVTRLLGDKIFFEGQPLGAERAARLSVIDRDLLILCLRTLTFGRKIWGITNCPHQRCGVKLDFTFDLSFVVLPPVPLSTIKSSSVSKGADRFDFSFREPNGLDQAAIAALAVSDPYAAWLNLCAGCIVKWGAADGISTEMLRELPREILLALDQSMAANMETLDWDIKLTCVDCEQSFVSTLDIQAYFWQELQFSSENLWEEIHLLALFYHWSEADILSLTRWKRKLYLGFINRQVDLKVINDSSHT
jgi:hypothetical protein